ncbi:efflux RND transporter periplasmic adaptor subunit [Rhizobium sp. G21]|uniref:efflux RND transporter periplasmic adaptor subunit n=1 Tax=Rhizobium sp. G21 TaxID=2758439 RepID=UPI0016036BA0|nr:efflux RND transporter periplasmic adaptor subunit [Rhizobium sp. G21]MBB1251460.1 efflux RND transporter periplasmic adaptor subunit [Rhizobium sp. G21]
MPVTVVIARQAPVKQQITVVGTLAAREETRVQASTDREIKQILVEVGQRVEAGQPLAILDTTDALLALDKNAASLERAGVAIAAEKSKVAIALVSEREAAERLNRSRTLQPKGAISNQTLDEHQNGHDRAIAELALARQLLALAEKDEQILASERREIMVALERCTVRATSAGTVIDRSARIGAVTSFSDGPLFVIARDGAIEFVADVTDVDFARLKEGMTARISVAGIDTAASGSVRLIAARLDPKTRSGSVRIALDAVEGLTPGAYARGVVETAYRSNVLLPGTAVRSAAGTNSVFVVENDRVLQRAVAVGARRDELVEIVDGVSAGEMVVVKAGGFLRDRDRIIPVPASVAGVEQRELSLLAAAAEAGEGVGP